MRRRVRRKPVSMTSLIDVIFLLLLFFMLSSTFSRFSNVEMDLGAAGGGGAAVEGAAFLRLGQDRLDLNGVALTLDTIAARLEAVQAPLLIVSVQPEVSAQRLTDLLVALGGAPEVEIVVLGDG